MLKYRRVPRRVYLVLFSVALCAESAIAQVDTTVYYPLQTGNSWFYSGETLFHQYYEWRERITGDTLMPNGKVYKQVLIAPDYRRYRRNENAKTYEYTGRCASGEEVLFDFATSDTAVWPRCFPEPMVTHRGVHGRKYRYEPLFGRNFERKVFCDVRISGGDTSWFPIVDASFPTFMAKGIGRVDITFSEVILVLRGAIINGVTYGTFTAVNDRENSPPKKPSISAYPNPFNASARIRFNLPKAEFVRLGVYNSLGQEVSVLIDGMTTAGEHEVAFEALNLPSGVYLCRFETAGRVFTEKIMLQK